MRRGRIYKSSAHFAFSTYDFAVHIFIANLPNYIFIKRFFFVAPVAAAYYRLSAVFLNMRRYLVHKPSV